MLVSRLALAATCCVATAIAIRYAILPLDMAPQFLPQTQAAMTPGRPLRAPLPDSAAEALIRRDPFRADRLPSRVRFGMDAEPESAPPARENRTPPPLVISGVVMSAASWAALVEGLPGVEGTKLLNQGEQFGRYRLTYVTASYVVVADPDTSWTLKVIGRAR